MRLSSSNVLASVGAVVSSTVTEVGVTAAMPLPATSVTAPASSSTVTAVSELVRAVANVISTVRPVVEWLLVLNPVMPDSSVIAVRSTVPMSSLKVRMIFEPSLEALGAPAPVVTSVGFTPSTLRLALAGTASWSRTASGLPPAEALIVAPLLSVSLSAATEMPSASRSLAATVYPAKVSIFEPLPTR